MILVDQYKEMHKDENLYAGSALTLHKESIRQFISAKKCDTILDYGCGKGLQYTNKNNFADLIGIAQYVCIVQYGIILTHTGVIMCISTNMRVLVDTGRY